MAIAQDLLSSPYTYLVIFVSLVLYPYLSDPLGINWVPGPALAKVSPLWLFWQARHARRFKSVHKEHLKHGRFVRLSTDHISINDPEAIPVVYGHGTGTLKAPFYDAFVSIHRGLFNTRDRAEHTRKRKIVSHVFSQQNVLGFERYIHSNLNLFLSKMDSLIDRSPSRSSATFDFLPWANYLAFDIIGDLAFGTPFGFVRDEADTNDGIRVLNQRGEWSATVGTMPYIKSWTPYMVFDPFFPRGLKSVKQLAQIAITAVEKRVAAAKSSDTTPTSSSSSPSASARTKTSDRKDLLSFLIKSRDENGNPMPESELQAEALTQLIAGSDTTSNSLTSILDVLCRNQEEYRVLRDSLDATMASLGITLSGTDEGSRRLATFQEVKGNTTLQNCIWEAMRIRPTSALGLPRVVPAGGLVISGRFFCAGTVVSVPSYTLHHDPVLYPDPYTFKPSRFDPATTTDATTTTTTGTTTPGTMGTGTGTTQRPPSEKEFVPFGYGPRGCIGRNLATMELLVVLANLLYRFEFEREDGGRAGETVVREGFLVKPTALRVVMTRRT